jgi:hypothetical protein
VRYSLEALLFKYLIEIHLASFSVSLFSKYEMNHTFKTSLFIDQRTTKPTTSAAAFSLPERASSRDQRSLKSPLNPPDIYIYMYLYIRGTKRG